MSALLLAACMLTLGACGESDEAQPIQTADAQGNTANAPAISVQDIQWTRSGSYLAGKIAFENRDMMTAAELLPKALADDVGNHQLAHQTLYALLSAGRIEQGIALAEKMSADGERSTLIALALIQKHARTGDYAGALEAARKLQDDRLLSIAGPMLSAWAAVGAQGPTAGIAELAPLEKIEGTAALRLMETALIQDYAKDRQAAEKSFKAALDETQQYSAQMIEFYADFLHRIGKTEDARALIQKYRDQARGRGDDVAAAMTLRLNGKPSAEPIVKSPDEGMAIALAQIGMELVSENLDGDAMWLTQLALDLDSHLDIAQVVLGDIYRQAEHLDLAIAAYDRVSKNSVLYRAARLSTAECLRMQEKNDEAEALLRDLVATGGEDTVAPVQLAALLRITKKFEESAEAYSTAINRLGTPTADDWQLFYYRGIAYERAKNWPPAEADFRKALELSPDEPYVLNYLAYTWVERREHLDEALKMLEKAVEQRPEEGFIIDSLGWAHYQLGHFDEAVKYLERAVELSPTDPVLNDHFGDALWRVGRKLEAEFQWRRALSFEPEADLVPQIEEKLKTGLAPAEAATGGGETEKPAQEPASSSTGSGG